MKTFSRGTHISRVLKSVSNDHLIASTTILSPSGFNGAAHSHENAHMSFVLCGGCAEKKKSDYERLPGSLTWYEAGEVHQITKVEVPSLHVNFELSSTFYEACHIDHDEIGRKLKRNPGSRAMMLKVFKELQLEDIHSIESLQTLLINIILFGKQEKKYEAPKWFCLANEMLLDRWNEIVGLQELSQTCGLHPVTLSKYFPRYFGCTLGEYQRKIKVNRAITLVQSKEFELSQVAFACGFSDQSHFIKIFKAHTGMLPSELRKLK